MSSLPPYNPAPSERCLWLLSAATPAPERQRLLASIGSPVVAAAGGVAELVEATRSGEGDLAVVAGDEVLEALVLALVGGVPGKARLRFIPGSLSQVQMLSDRAVLRHLNQGAAT